LKQVFFVRHGQTKWNAARRVQGQWNSDLNKLGRVQAEINGQLLSRLNIDALFASPLDRTRQTAEIINRHLKLPINFDERIKEWDCGDWSGYLYDEVRKRWSKEWEAYQADRYYYRGPNCENIPDMMERARPFLDEIIEHPANNIAIISHGMIGKIMVSMLLGLNEKDTLDLGQPNDVVFKLTLSDETKASHFVRGNGPIEGYQVDS